jgi:hypothetical protein
VESRTFANTPYWIAALIERIANGNTHLKVLVVLHGGASASFCALPSHYFD